MVFTMSYIVPAHELNKHFLNYQRVVYMLALEIKRTKTITDCNEYATIIPLCHKIIFLMQTKKDRADLQCVNGV